jgi:hypothetical protein
MIRMFLAGALVLAALAVVQPARAAEAPWCAVIDMGRGDAYWDCQYRTLKSCVPTVLGGNRGFCNPNPAYAGPAPAKPAQIRHRRRVRR